MHETVSSNEVCSSLLLPACPARSEFREVSLANLSDFAGGSRRRCGVASIVVTIKLVLVNTVWLFCANMA